MSVPIPKDVRVVMADDSLVMRHFLRQLLEAHPRIIVVGEARNGREALESVKALHPDVLVLDVEMPVMNGIDALERIMGECPLPVVMFSSGTRNGAEVTLEALSLGAVDFVPKPATRVNLASIGSEICQKVISASSAVVRPARRRSEKPLAPRIQRRDVARDNAGALCVIGSSTGGPSALETIIPALSSELRGSILVCQHMPPGFTSSLARRLDSISRVQVKEAEDGDLLLAGRVLVVPGGSHAGIRKDKMGVHSVRLDQSPPVHGVRPSVDVVLADAARLFGPNLLVSILTGMGSDGAKGSLVARSHGARIVCQDEETSTVWGMPRACLEAGASQEQVPLTRMASAIQEFFSKKAAPKAGRS